MKKLFYLLGISVLLGACTVSKPITTNPKQVQKESKNSKNDSETWYPKDSSIKDFKAPEYPSGTKGLLRFIGVTANYPMKAAEKRMQGEAIVEILVTKEGKVENVRIKKSTGYKILDDEAVIAVSKIPYFKPGTDANGNTIDCYGEVKVGFRLVG